MPNKLTYVAVLGAVFMLAPFAIDMYLPALPTIAADLQTGIDELEATVAILPFGYGGPQLVLGPVSDSYGRRGALIGGLVTYTLASILAGTAQSIEQLYLWRFFQAIGGAGSVVVFPMVRERFGDKEGSQIISYIMALTVIAPLVAPIIGAFVLLASGWIAIFFLLAAFGGVTLLAASILVPGDGGERRPLSVHSIIRTYGLVLKERRILTAILAGGFAFAGLFAFVAGSPFVYISFFDVSPQAYSLLVGLNALAMIGANLVNARWLTDVDPVRKVLTGAGGLAVAGAGLLAFALAGASLAWMVATVVVYVGALGLTATNAIVAALSVLPKENGSVSAINGALQFAIGAVASLAVSVMVSVDAVPMALVMAGCGALALACAAFLMTATVEPSHA
ncbi:MAG: multidrug effflux MFS transporter [Hyphomicrobiales bacterium]|nr:multidrug effflux MFS transporter [Hyphomicrobiales bacterium]